MSNLYEDISCLDLGKKKKLLEIVRKSLNNTSQDTSHENEMSEEQKRFYLNYKIDKNSTAYNMPILLKISKQIDLKRLETSINYCINQCDIFRTTFYNKNDVFLFNIADEIHVEIEYINSDEPISSIVQKFVKPFCLEELPLIRIAWITTNNIHYLLFDMPHILGDGVSIDILIKRIINFYLYDIEFSPVKNYADYNKWKSESWINSNEFNSKKEYWIKQLSNFTRLYLPYDKKIPTGSSRTKEYTISLNGESALALKSIISEYQVTDFMYFIGMFGFLLSEYTGQDDILIGYPVSGRVRPNSEEVIGPLVNMLAFRSLPKKDKILCEYISETKKDIISGLSNQEYPFNQLVNDLGIGGQKHPLFNTMFSYRNVQDKTIRVNDCIIEHCNIDGGEAKYDLSLEVEKDNNEYHITFIYSEDLFSEALIQNIARNYISILQLGEKYSKYPLSQIDYLCEKEELMNNFRGVDCKINKSFLDYFNDNLQNNSNKKIVISTDNEVDYLELDSLSNKVANYVSNTCIDSQTVIGVMFERNINMIACLLGIIKAGGAYLPIDIDYPDDRKNYIISDSGIKMLFTSDKVNTKNIVFDGEIIHEKQLFENENSCFDIRHYENSGLAYMIYTSGSTGKPKGVEIGREALDNFIAGMKYSIDFEKGSRILGLTTISFDIFVLETWVALALGKTIVLANQEQQKSPKILLQMIKDYQIDILQITPSRLRMMMKYDYAIRYLEKLNILLIGGEAFPEDLLEQLYEMQNTLIYNVYGPTETTVWSSVCKLEKETPVSAGYPIANTSFYILRDKKMVPIGAQGNLFIGGKGVAQGYHFKDELTKERFIVNPYNNKEIIYDTGDVAQFSHEGETIILGRKDNQVKLDGYRIELEEIEQVILTFEKIASTAVLIHNSKIWAFYVKNGDFDVARLKNFINEKLPRYMIPNYFKEVNTIPLNSNGKVDRTKLSHECTIENLDTSKASPRNEKERKIAECIKEVLKIENVSIFDSFFDLGGNSINAIQLEFLCEKKGLNITVNDIYNKPSIAELCNDISYGNFEQFELNIGAIKPFNELFYISCFYSSLIPVFKSIVGTEIPLMANGVSVYNMDNGFLDSEYVLKYSVEEILDLNDVKYKRVDVDLQCSKTIIDYLESGCVLICWIDCYYLSYRKDKYLKEHFPHTVLVVASENDELLILDQSSFDLLDYSMRKISVKEFIESMNGIKKFYNELDEKIWVFSLDNLDSACVCNTDLFAMYKKLVVDNIQRIDYGISQIETYINMHVSILSDDENILNGLNRIIDSCRARVYLYNRISPTKELIRLSDIVLESWLGIRKKVIKYLMISTLKCEDDLIKYCEKKLAEIVVYEKALIESLTKSEI